ncbi:MAG: 1-deoxy-D-xylulose-5-phosphate reductoisomerase [bacterium]|nr:MAG: 1-deoxy-D-xylulose-5-phosphate reductoisomerase [bacterium]
MKRVVILGSTGSIGRSAIEIIDQTGDDFEVSGLVAGKNIDELEKQLVMYPRSKFAVGYDDALNRLLARDGTLGKRAFGSGSSGIENLLRETQPDLVINALVGISGLLPTFTAFDLGCSVAIANKETLVTAGELITPQRAEHLIPVDSEHFSISRCLDGYRDEATEIVLTASGGPFYRRKYHELADVSVEDVLDHPTWKMGKKVSVDSAHLLNKGLEVIEAHWLFRFPYRSIKVLIHPQSIIHSIVRLRDGSFMAHLGPADMRLPIMSALYHPDIKEFPWRSLDFDELGTLELHPLDEARYPAFRAALAAAETGGTAPAVLNAADEVAVGAFLEGKIGFLTIVDWIEEALSAHRARKVLGVEDVLEADRWARDLLMRRHSEIGHT